MAIHIADMHPHELVAELDRYIVGQTHAKQAIAVALRNRWRRTQLQIKEQELVVPKNVMVIGNSGTGKSATIARAAKIIGAPFIKAEATAFTETGYVGRDVNELIGDLYRHAYKAMQELMLADIGVNITKKVDARILSQLTPKKADKGTRELIREKYRAGLLEDSLCHVEVEDPSTPKAGRLDIFSMMNSLKSTRTVKVHRARAILRDQLCQAAVDKDELRERTIEWITNYGIIFIDEIDKTCSSDLTSRGAEFRQGVQRNLLTLVEGTTVNVKGAGPIDTDQILFVVAGAFHYAKPTDLMPEFQGRFPVVVHLKPIDKEAMVMILDGIDNSILEQYRRLLSVENITLTVKPEAVDLIAAVAVWENQKTNQDIGARRLNGLVEKVFDRYLYDAGKTDLTSVTITPEIVSANLGLSKSDMADILA